MSDAAFNPVTHVIFDMDGLLLDTEPLYTIGIQKFLDQYDKTYTWDIKLRTMGMSYMEEAELLIDELSLPCTVDDYVTGSDAILHKLFETIPLLPGAQKLLTHFSKFHIPMAVCTGSRRSIYELKTTNHKHLFSLFDHTVCIPDEPEIASGKPDPACYRVTAARFPGNPDPARILVFEDAPNGVEAARNAGSQVVMVPDPRVDTEVLGKATLVLKSLEDFRPEIFGLPAFEETCETHRQI